MGGKGIDTVLETINRWAPSNENDTQAYAGAVAKRLSVRTTDSINIKDPTTLRWMSEVLGERGARQEEQRRATAQEEVRAHAQEERTIADAGADAAGQRLQHEGAKLAATVSCTGTDTAAVARGQAATRAAMVLSELRDRADARAGELAKAYDRARIAGLACEASYNALTN